MRVRFPMRSLDFSIDPILPVTLFMTTGSTQPLTEMNTRRLARKADLIVICEPRRLGLHGLLDIFT
jgi:hypothetical protein